MEQNENRFLPPEKIKANIGITLTKEFGNYLEDVCKLEKTYVGEDNIPEVQSLMKRINSFLAFGEKNRKSEKEPFLNQGREIDKAYLEFFSPMEKVKQTLQAKLNAVAKLVADKAAKEAAEKAKKTELINRLNQFVIDYSVKISSATTNAQLIDIERVINLEKGRKDVYGDMLPLLTERCNDLTGKIKDQKELVKEHEAIEKAKKEAENSGDDKKLEDLLKREAEIDSEIQDNTVKVQEVASNNLILPDSTEENDIDTPKARRTAWKAEIVDINTAVKKAKDMLRIELEPEKVRQSISTLKGAGVLNGKDELIVNGIRYYQEKTF